MKAIAISQSNYIPWKGTFDVLATMDEFVLFDAMQYTRRDWRNRNQIKTRQGLKWLSIPVETKGKYFQAVDETRISDPRWPEQHWETIRHAYGKAPCFAEYGPKVQALYEGATQPLLSQVNRHFLEGICQWLGITTPLLDSRQFPLAEDKTGRLVEICRLRGATDYYTGPAAKAYMEPAQFASAGIGLHYVDYSGYPEYPQLYGEFEHGVTILDLLFSVGSAFPSYMKHAGR